MKATPLSRLLDPMTWLVLVSALVFATALCLTLPHESSAQSFEAGKTVTIQTEPHKFADPVKRCLAMCVETIVERQEFECAPFVAPPLTGCDLPWIDPDDPNPFYSDGAEQCIPEKGELAGFGLLQRAELVQRIVVQTADCTSTVTETVLQQLPTSGNNTRACPDPGPWLERNEVLRSFIFRSCP
jgi:hypothetical protein